jgi:hypothetical protein
MAFKHHIWLIFSVNIFSFFIDAPRYVSSSRVQAAERFLHEFRVRSGDAFSQHSLLAELEQSHPDLFHHLMVENFEELAVAMAGRGVTAACLRYGDIPRKRGALHLSVKDLGTVYKQLKELVDHLALEANGMQYRVMVISDGEVRVHSHQLLCEVSCITALTPNVVRSGGGGLEFSVSTCNRANRFVS